MRTRHWRPILVTVLVTASLVVLLQRTFWPSSPFRSLDQRSYELLWTVIQLIKSDYVEEPDPSKTMEGGFRGLVASLDVVSSYLDAGQAAKFAQAKKTALKETGAILFKPYGTPPQPSPGSPLLVLSVLEDSPAQKSGLRPGDYISSINGRSTFDLSVAEAQLALKGNETQPLKVKVLRQNDTLELELERRPPSAELLSLAAVKETQGVLRLHRLAPSAAARARQKLAALPKNGQGPLVLDLRDCYEGDFEEARKFLNLFLMSAKVGAFVDRQGVREAVACPAKAEFESLPLVVWTNAATMGAAELVAGVLQEAKRAKVVGVETPGVVARTDLWPLSDGSALLLTSSVFALNSGKRIFGQGVEPDSGLGVREASQAAYLKKTLEASTSR